MEQSICLCYTKEKGIFIGHRCKDHQDSIFEPYDYKGYKIVPVSISDENIELIISSNFHFDRKSYLYAEINCNNIPWLDFSTEQLRVLWNCSVTRFSVASEDWVALFKKIVDAYKTYKKTATCLTKAIRYVEELGKLFGEYPIRFKTSMHEEKFIQWDGKSVCALYVADKLQDLLNGLHVGNIEDKVLSDYTLTVCQIFLRTLKQLNLSPSDPRTIRFAYTLSSVCEFMAKHNADKQFLMEFNSRSSIAQ